MYDVKQADPAEWSSPPFEAALVDKPGFGKVLIGRGAVNQKGPEATLAGRAPRVQRRGPQAPGESGVRGRGRGGNRLAALPAGRPAARGSRRALKKCAGVYMPMPMQSLDGTVTINLGAKGVIELELVSSGERWHRGPKQDLHSSNEARVDSPAWHLVQALATLVGPDGHTPAIDGYADKARPLSCRGEGADSGSARSAERRRGQETDGRRTLGSRRGLAGISGTAGGPADGEHRGTGRPDTRARAARPILPHRAVAKLDLRLVPGHDRARCARGPEGASGEARLRRHRSQYDWRLRSHHDAANSALIQAQAAVYRRNGARSGLLAAAGRLVARLRFHRRAAQVCRPDISAWAMATARTRRRIPRDRIGESKSAEASTAAMRVASRISLRTSRLARAMVDSSV